MFRLQIFGFDGILPLELFFEYYLFAAEIRHKPATIDANRSRLLGNRQPMNWVSAFNACGVFTTQMNPYDLAAAKTLMKNSCKGVDTEYAHFDSALNGALEWGISYKHVFLTKWDFKTVKQGKKAPAKIQLAPAKTINVLCTRRLGVSDEEHLQNNVLMEGGLLRSGDRTGKEILGIREKDLNENDLSVTLHRENGDVQNIPMRRNDFEKLSNWVRVKRAHQSAYLKAGGKPAEDEDAVFINLKPVWRNGSYTWLMSKETIAKNLKSICEANDVEYVAPSVLRRNSCVNGQIAGMGLGYHESYISLIKGHKEETERDYYSRILGPEIEFINRLLMENIEFCERIIAHSVYEFLENPRQLRHLACAWSTFQSLGRFELREKLTRYRSGTLDLDRFPAKPAWAAVTGINPSVIGKKLLISICMSLFRWFAK